MEERAWHNIKPNEQTRIPARHVFIDSEAYRERGRNVETQRWRCGVAIYAKRKRDGTYTQSCADYCDAESMWADVSDFTSGTGRTVVWAHNLAYDARITGVFEILPAFGWTLKAHNIAPRGTWLEWRRDKQCLILVDSFSVFPTSIEQMGIWLDMGKPDLPEDDAEMDTWLDRCRADCSILATAILRYLQWIKAEDLGNWQLTGNGQSWATFRHKFLTHTMTVHDDKEALEAERKAMWAGRCEAYFHGEILDRRVYEYDFVAAYPRIARDYEVPVKLLGVLDNPGKTWEVLTAGRHAVLAEVTVTTDVPVVPTEHEGRILWPTGEFQTTLWDVEIQAALDAGAKVQMGRAWVYRKAPALRAWAEWVLERGDSDDDTVPAWQKTILKHWSRALIGRMAMSYQKWDYDGEMPWAAVQSGISHDTTTGVVTTYMHIGHEMWLHAGRQEWKHSMPMITGYVQAVARVQLWDVLRRLPIRAALYCDTDSVYVTSEFVPEMEQVIAEIPGCGLRMKRSWLGIAIYGPRQIITGKEVRISGVPKRAQRVGKQVFRGEVWEGVGTAIQFGHANTVRIRQREWTVTGVDYRRQDDGSGWTDPHDIGMEEP